uniref:Uncharacterized protein n=1 Tax=Anopheles melas TaxID=34690 RepID=A0A182UH81_9DIPT
MRELYDLITGKNVDHQTFESVSAIIQKRFTNAGNWFQGKRGMDSSHITGRLGTIPLILVAMLLYLSVGSALALLLLQNDLALPFHRLAGIYVLYDIRRKEQAESPFFLFLARFLEPFGGLLPANSSTPAQMVELKFIHLLLSNGDPD